MSGHDGYGFPKWVTNLDVDINDTKTSARVAHDTGGTDVSYSAATPKQQKFRPGDRVGSLTSYTTINGAWHSVMNQTNTLSPGSTRSSRNVSLELGKG